MTEHLNHDDLLTSKAKEDGIDITDPMLNPGEPIFGEDRRGIEQRNPDFPKYDQGYELLSGEQVGHLMKEAKGTADKVSEQEVDVCDPMQNPGEPLFGDERKGIVQRNPDFPMYDKALDHLTAEQIGKIMKDPKGETQC